MQVSAIPSLRKVYGKSSTIGITNRLENIDNSKGVPKSIIFNVQCRYVIMMRT